MADSNEKEIRYVGVRENLAYGFANAGQVFGYNLVAGGYLSLFFIKVFGIPSEAVSLMILILGAWDTINDPLMGGIIDKTRTRYGKLRPYLLFVPIPLSIATIMLFAGPEILADAKSTTIKIVYMYISYFVWEFFYTIGDVPFWGMSTAISPSPSDRTRAISTARFISSILAVLPSKSSTKLASVPVVPRQPRKRIVSMTKSSSSRSATRSCIHRVARLPTVTSWAG